MCRGIPPTLILSMILNCSPLYGKEMDKDKEKRMAKAAKDIIKKEVNVKKLQKKGLSALGIKEDIAKKIGAAAMVGKTLVDRELDIDANKNLKIKLKLKASAPKSGSKTVKKTGKTITLA